MIDAARAELRGAGLEGRIRLHAGDVRTWTPEKAGVGYDLILLLNNIYYFRAERAARSRGQWSGSSIARGLWFP